MKKRNWIVVAALSILSTALSVSSWASRSAEKDIVDTAASVSTFSTLVAAVQAADLVSALKSEGPFTVFAPTNEAFAKLPRGTVETLLKPENKSKLVKILTYHVIPGRVPSSAVAGLKNGTDVKTLQGQTIKVFNKGGVRVNNAKVVKTDIMATNGVIHVIDTVILPK